MSTIYSIIQDNWMQEVINGKEKEYHFHQDLLALDAENINILLGLFHRIAQPFLPKSITELIPQSVQSSSGLDTVSSIEICKLLKILMFSEFLFDNYFTTNRD